jgi:hypothetical protein
VANGGIIARSTVGATAIGGDPAKRVGLIEGAQDAVGLQRLKSVLGATYANLAPGCDPEVLKEEGLRAIHEAKAA